MKEHFDTYLKNQVDKYNGIAFPVKSGILRRALVKKAKVMDLHPNPDDEFTHPDVGPSYRIISEYEAKVKHMLSHGEQDQIEPIIVEKMHPEGYMIVNGHHRWAAFYRMDVKKVPVSVVNLTHQEDIIKMLESASNNKRITLDLDEVVFGNNKEDAVEKKPFLVVGPLNKARMKKGIPALFNFFSQKGYDIWLYTSDYYSIEYIRYYMKKYHVHVTGIMNGTQRNVKMSDIDKLTIDKKIAAQYKYTLNIDNDNVIRIDTETKDFTDYEIDTEKNNWSQAIMDIVGNMKDEEG